MVAEFTSAWRAGRSEQLVIRSHWFDDIPDKVATGKLDVGLGRLFAIPTRVRHESRIVGTREGTLRALEATGSVVTGAGIILAGTFGALALLPLEPLVQIGTTVAVCVLIDTFIVRALLVPSLTYLLGDRAWWPARMSDPDTNTKVRASPSAATGDQPS